MIQRLFCPSDQNMVPWTLELLPFRPSSHFVSLWPLCGLFSLVISYPCEILKKKKEEKKNLRSPLAQTGGNRNSRTNLSPFVLFLLFSPTPQTKPKESSFRTKVYTALLEYRLRSSEIGVSLWNFSLYESLFSFSFFRSDRWFDDL